MAYNDEGITSPSADALIKKAESKYGLVIFGARRARQINAYYSQLHENLFDHVGPLVESDPNEKSLSIAMREINENLIEAQHIEGATFDENGQLELPEETAFITENLYADEFATPVVEFDETDFEA